MRNKFIKLLILTLLTWTASARADKICPPGYRDGQENYEPYETEYYVTFQGKTYQCLEGSYSSVRRNLKCSDRITVHSGMKLSLLSQEGKEFEFSRNNPVNTTTKDCSAGSFCIERTQSTNHAENEYVKFSIPITMVYYKKTACDKVSF